MRWEFGRRSDNIEDQRGNRGAAPVIVGGGLGTVILALVVALLGGDPSAVLQQAPPANDPTANINQPRSGQPTNPAQDQEAQFVSAVLAQTEDTWNDIFNQLGRTYQEPKLVLFSNVVQSACGYAKAASGPFYCPLDQKVYIDLSFFRELQTRLNAPGDFARAYVIAHEVGHHVQNQLGIARKVSALQQRVSRTEANQLSVMLELQADCFAGVWANRTEKAKQILEQGDVEEALNAASQIGDDRLQAQSQGYIVPDAFTHGSSTQRVRWFKQGLQTGSLSQCDTFNASRL
jgi:uncharacterized protein